MGRLSKTFRSLGRNYKGCHSKSCDSFNFSPLFFFFFLCNFVQSNLKTCCTASDIRLPQIWRIENTPLSEAATLPDACLGPGVFAGNRRLYANLSHQTASKASSHPLLCDRQLSRLACPPRSPYVSHSERQAPLTTASSANQHPSACQLMQHPAGQPVSPVATAVDPGTGALPGPAGHSSPANNKGERKRTKQTRCDKSLSSSSDVSALHSF